MIEKKKCFYFLILSILISACTFNDKNNPVQVTEPGIPYNPVPADGAVGQENIITLKWSISSADSFTILFDTQNPPKKVLKKNLTQNSFTTFAAGNSTTYFWQVIAKYKNGAATSSSIWRFTTKSTNTNTPGYVMKNFGITTHEPNIIKALFQVTDLNNSGVTNLSASDFEVYEDGKKISSHESLLNVTKKDDNFFKLNTVLMIDISTSVTDDPNNLTEIKNAAKNFISNMFQQQFVSIYTFSSKVNLVLPSTSVSEQSKIFSAIDGISPGARSTDLYGAVIEGASKLNTTLNADSIISSALVLFTDGDDTQGSHTFQQALNSIVDKNVYTIGLGPDLNPEVMTALGKNGYYSISQINQLSQTFLIIQNDLSKLANSFYWLEYQSPKRGNFLHLLQIVIINNPLQSIIEAQFNSSKFYDPVPGIYFTDKYGNKIGDSEIPLIAGGNAVEINVATYGGKTNPNYRWSIDTSLTLQNLNSIFSHVRISAKSNVANQTKSKVIVTDLNNSFSSELNFVITKSFRKRNASRY